MSLLPNLLCLHACVLAVAIASAACSDDETTTGWDLIDGHPGICENGCEPLSSCQGKVAEEVEFSSQGGHTSLTDLELEPSGCPRALYERGDRVEYVEWDGQAWRGETVATNAPVHSSVDVKSDLAIDAHGRSTVGVVDADGQVRFAWRDERGEWQSESLPDVGRVSALIHEIDPHGRPVMLIGVRDFGESSQRALVYAVRDQQSWTTEKVPAEAPSTGLRDSLVFDRRGRPHIAFSGDGSSGVFYGVREEGGAWSIERLVEEPQVVYRGASLALDADDNPHVLFCPPPAVHDEDVVTHLHRTLAGWQTQIVQTEETYTPWCHALSFDADDRLHAVYLWQRGISQTELRHATWSNGEWQVETLDTNGYGKPEPRMVVDSRQGIIHLFTAADRTPEHGWTVSPAYSFFPLDADAPEIQ